nr:reverse transcriptase domain-containing protein [Tanacetum cinerariifolium]
ENLQSRVKEEDSITDVENTFEDQSLHVSGPSRLCVQAQSGDDMPFRKQACTEYTRWVFCKVFGRPRERHLACLTRMHDSRPLYFQGFVLNHDLIPPPDHLFEGPSRLCVQAQSGDDMPFRKQACTEYTRWVFCKVFGRPRERHLACLTRMHDSRPLYFQGFVLNHDLIPPPDHLFEGDTGTQRSNLAFESFLAKRYLRAEWSVYTMLLFMMRTAPIAKSLASHISSKGKSQLGAIKIGASTVHWSSYLRKVFYESSIESGMTKKATDTLDGGGMSSNTELEHKAYWALKHANFDLKTTGDHRKLQLNELNELRDQAYENSLIYKERTMKLHDDKIKNRIFNVGDQVLLFNSKLKIFSGKLKSRWSSPFTIAEIYPYGTAKLIHPDGCNFKVNCHRLKHYHEGDPPPLEISNVTTFPKEN